MSEEGTNPERGISRRAFLNRGTMGLAGVVALSLVTGRLVISALRGRRQPPTFPKGSVFTPSRDSLNRKT